MNRLARPGDQDLVVLTRRQIGTVEHRLHIRHIADVPSAEIEIRQTRIVEHELHVQYATDVPGADVLIEGRGLLQYNRGPLDVSSEI